MSNHKVSKAHAAELKAMSIRAHEIAVEDGMESVSITGYPFGDVSPYVYIHAKANTSPDGATVKASGAARYHHWHRDGIKYAAVVRVAADEVGGQ
jgi:hypothetical protein